MSALPALIDPQTSEVLAPRARTARRLAGAWTGTSTGQGVPLPETKPETKPRAKPVARPSITELPAAPEARPFVKWAGGKRQLLAQLMTHVPRRFGAYHEPFVGGGALFYQLGPSVAYLSDANERLIRTYRAIRNGVDDVITLLRTYPHDQEFFLRLRQSQIDEQSDTHVAAWFIYLNKTAFNGLYRVNRANRFNVPFGDFKNPCICDEGNLRACSQALARAQVQSTDFSVVLERACPGDLVYFDPPYVPLSTSASFVSYTRSGFGLLEQRRLRDTALQLKRRGVTVILSNSAHPVVQELYAHHFQIHEVQATRAINSKSDRRGPVREFIIS